MWTHANATKHIYETIISIKENPKIKNANPKLYTQFIMHDFWHSLGSSVKNGITYDKKITNGNWEFIFSKQKKLGNNPVIKRAKFTGFKQ